ncbi:hypothetical protein JOB18_000196 [Solea senegalensis]|uniref:ALMS motif domain-containing protein n=1 Tax=Solea senegalensis TaxID=28829 RepID=A0AAV6PDV8_SOLSE|nr:hypothetical protein JOB18_000196 [Solea senegalensis]
MKKKLARIRPSPNEEARILKEEHERRRKLRIQQVREQQRQIALQIRQAVEQRRQCELEQLGEELRLDWEQQQREKLDKLQRLYQESLQLLGQGHRDAKENEPDLAAIAQREEENHAKAEQRHQQALKELKSQRLEEHERQNKSIKARKKALQIEKERSAKVASLPPPPTNPIQNIDFKKPHVVKKSDVSSFAATHYHMPESTVDREVDTQQRNAHEEADLEVRRLQDLQREAMRRRGEQLEKARLRGRQALKREQLIQDRDRLLVELEHMQQTDMLRRRQQVSQMPPQIFQPLYKRQEAREDFQREMEFAFEDMYTGERRVKGDLVVQLEPEPLPALSTGSQDQELDVTLDEITTQGTEHASHEAARTELDTSAQVEPTKPAPRRALRKLLDRIRSQRNQYNEHSSHVAAADSQTVVNDQIPERDTTIETGSLTNSPPSSDEKNKQPSIELPEPHSAIESETTETSTGGDSPFSDELRNRIQEFEEEQKKREEELEREKQQQVVLLQDLENQKVKLEQMLLEAQQEREWLKAAAKQQVNINQPDVSEQDQDLLSVCPGQAPELQPPAGEHNHTHRIREYQQRLLEQNGPPFKFRIHQRSVEVARRRLEEYQRALRIRYNMTSTSLLPAVLPTGLRHQPPHRSHSMQLPMPSHGQNQPQTFVEVPTRESNAHVSSLPLPGSSLIAGSKMQPDEMESTSNNSRNHRLEQSVWLTDNIMERVTGHLPESVRLCSPNMQPQHKLSSSTIPLQLRPDSPISPSSLPLDHEVLGKSGTLLHGALQTASLTTKDDDIERWRLELQDVQRRVLEQREAVVQRQRLQQEERQRQEEQRRRQEMEMEQMRQQKETLQALIDTDSGSTADGAAEVQVTENIGQTRLRLLVSLLKAIEESNGGTLSHLENPQEDRSNSNMTGSITQISAPVGPAPASILPPGLFLPLARAAKPPVTRIRLGTMAAGTDQHELSAIPEVETPVNSQVTGLGVSMNFPSHNGAWELQEQSDLSVSSVSHTTGRTPSSGSSSSRSSHWVWRERLLTGAWTSPEYSESDSFQRKTSPFSSDSGRGADYPAPALTSYRSPTESRHRCPDSDLSSTISTGSYVTTDFEQNTNTDKLPPLRPSEEQRPRAVVSSVSGQSLFIKDNSAAPCPGSIIRDAAVAAHPSSLVERTSAAGHHGSFIESMSAAGRPDSLVEGTSAAGRPSSLVEETSAAGRPDSLVEGTSAAGHAGSLVEVASAAGRPGSLVEGMSAAGRPSSLVEGTSAAGRLGSSVEDTLDAGCPSSLVEGTSTVGCSGSLVEDRSLSVHPDVVVESLFNDRSIQRIIDRYTRELDVSLSIAGKTTDSEGLSVVQGSKRQVEDKGAQGPPTPLLHTPGTRTQSSLISDTTADLLLVQPSQAEDSFRPLIGQLADQSSCLAVESAMEQLVGQPFAHSSMIGHLSSVPGQGGWDSTLSRIISRLSHQSSSGQNCNSGQLMGPMVEEPSTSWLDEGQEESRMRPLVAELDTDHHSGVSGEFTHLNLGISAEDSLPSHPALPAEASSHSATAPGVSRRSEEQMPPNQTSPVLLESESTEVFPVSDSFHALLAEVTHNETADPFMTFHLLEHKVLDSAEGELACGGSGQSDTHTDPSVESELSPEHLRAEKAGLHSSCQYQPDESFLTLEESVRTDVEKTALNLSNITMCDDDDDDAPDLEVLQPTGAAAGRSGVSENPQDSYTYSENVKSEQCSDLSVPLSDEIFEAPSEKGILEQSEITLLSLTDATLQDQETTIAEEDRVWEDIFPYGEGQNCHKNEGAESMLVPEERLEDKDQTHPVTFLEFEWDQSRSLQQVNQQKCRALLQRSRHRLQDIKAKQARVKNQLQAPSEVREEPESVDCEETIQPESQQKTNNGTKEEQAEQQLQTEKETVRDSRLKKTDGVKICTPEQRKHHVSEMYQRTRRLYEQLEEVKQQKTIRSRQEAYVQNRLKAQEFHKKTLQKLRAKQKQQ